MTLKAEEVAYWFFRLNGFLATSNFVVHPNTPGRQLTDIDVLGVRFPERAEFTEEGLEDSDIFRAIGNVPFIAIVEVKTGECQINSTLRNRDNGNVQRVLRSLGALPRQRVEIAAQEIYSEGAYMADGYHVSLCAIGEYTSQDLTDNFPQALQITWDTALDFIYRRFGEYRNRKWDHEQWDTAGKVLWKAAAHSHTVESFKDLVRKLWVIAP
jgi:uncharacterized protein with GYD domain